MSQRLTEHREAAGLTKTELALKAGVTERTVRNIERGEYKPSYQTARKIADVLGVPMESLVAQTNEEEG